MKILNHLDIKILIDFKNILITVTKMLHSMSYKYLPID